MKKFILFAITNLLVLSSDIGLNIFSLVNPLKSSSVVVAQSSQVVIDGDLPSNVRKTPNGQIICSIKTPTVINTYGYTNGWYETKICGSNGYIHESQVRSQPTGNDYFNPNRTEFHPCDNPTLVTGSQC